MGLVISKTALAIIWFILLSALSFIRNIKIFAMMHVFADLIILIMTIVVLVCCFIKIQERGSMLETVPFYGQFSDDFGFSIYAFEGKGLVLPI